jgi:hypothetical protein
MKYKHALLAVALLLCSQLVNAQRQNEEEELEEGGFKTENIFLGGTLNLGYGGGTGGSSFVVGVNPEIGYSVAEWLDAGFVFNCIYNSYKHNDYSYGNISQKAFNYGAGVFARLHIFSGVFLQAQPEYNWISYNTTYRDFTPQYKEKNTVSAGSILVGGGYAQRVIGENTFYTVILFDLSGEKYSPYVDGYGNKIPQIRAGFNFYLGRKKP